MVSKDVLAKFLKLASDRIFSGLDSNKWSGSEREAALTVLKNRGKDVTKYLNDEPAFQKPTEEKLQNLTNLVTKILSKDDKDLIDKVYGLIGEGEDFSNLSAETVDYAIESINKWTKEARIDKEIAERKAQRGRDADKRVKDQEFTAEKQSIVDRILNDKSLTKKQKVVTMFAEGLTRTEVLSLRFADATYIYDLYRDWKKNA